MMHAVDIGIFAHNEADRIAAMLAGLLGQSLLAAPNLRVRILVLANGCTDATVHVARAAWPSEGAAVDFAVADLPQGGKSRTWNRFVHDLSRREAELLIFCDADIDLPQSDTLLRLVQGLATRPDLMALNSRPVKDIIHAPQGLTLTDRLIAAGADGLDDWRSAICGQLYAMPAAAARQFHLPIGLPVEDGFLRAAILTTSLTEEVETMTRIDGAEGAFHVYASERRIPALIRHQTRIIIGSAVNAACFAHLRALPAADRRAELARAATSDDWLSDILRKQLPRRPFGYVPLHFVVKRLVRAGQSPRRILHPRRAMALLAGFAFDVTVYIRAQLKMARGLGPGFW